MKRYTFEMHPVYASVDHSRRDLMKRVLMKSGMLMVGRDVVSVADVRGGVSYELQRRCPFVDASIDVGRIGEMYLPNRCLPFVYAAGDAV